MANPTSIPKAKPATLIVNTRIHIQHSGLKSMNVMILNGRRAA
jgi:hypothetical protein